MSEGNGFGPVEVELEDSLVKLIEKEFIKTGKYSCIEEFLAEIIYEKLEKNRSECSAPYFPWGDRGNGKS
ncbi:MAG: hypothetical protein LUQ07_01990 [Methanospirillum sp.]|nr:hypothetical protein [Methanospirillum sp.]